MMHIQPLHTLLLEFLPHRYLTNAMLLVGHSTSPLIGSLAVSLLTALSTHVAPMRLLHVLQDSGYVNDVVGSFVKALQAPETSSEADSCGMTSGGMASFEVLEEKKREDDNLPQLILELILDNLTNQPSPNIAHSLLGLEGDNNAAGDHTAPNVLTAIVERLLSAERIVSSPKLSEACYHVLEVLVNSPNTCQATMKHLEHVSFFSIQWSIALHLASLRRDESDDRIVEDQVALVQCRSWILRLIAIRLHVLEPSSRLATQLKDMVRASVASRRLGMIELLSQTSFICPPPPLPNLGSFTSAFLTAAEASTSHPSSGIVLIQIPKLNEKINQDATLKRLSPEQCRVGLAWALAYSHYTATITAEKNALTAWHTLLQRMGRNTTVSNSDETSILLEAISTCFHPSGAAELMQGVAQITVTLIGQYRQGTTECTPIVRKLFGQCIGAILQSGSWTGDRQAALKGRTYLYTVVCHLLELLPSSDPLGGLHLPPIVSVIGSDIVDASTRCIGMSLLERLVLRSQPEGTTLTNAEPLQSLCTGGHLQAMIATIRQIATALDENVHAQDETHVSFWIVVLESTLSLFTSIGSTGEKGAEKLVEYGLVRMLLDYGNLLLNPAKLLPRRTYGNDINKGEALRKRWVESVWMPSLRCVSSIAVASNKPLPPFSTELTDFLTVHHPLISYSFKTLMTWMNGEIELTPQTIEEWNHIVLLLYTLQQNDPLTFVSNMGHSRIDRYTRCILWMLFTIPTKVDQLWTGTTPLVEEYRTLITRASMFVSSRTFSLKNDASSGSMNSVLVMPSRQKQFWDDEMESHVEPATMEMLLSCAEKMDRETSVCPTKRIVMENITSMICQHLVFYHGANVCSRDEIHVFDSRLKEILKSTAKDGSELANFMLQDRQRAP